MEFIGRLAAKFGEYNFRMVRTTHAHAQTKNYVWQCGHWNQVQADM